MAKAEKSSPTPAAIGIGGSQCLAHGCSKKPARAEFCEEHFKWFKVGLITARGERAKDFDKKIQAVDKLLALY